MMPTPKPFNLVVFTAGFVDFSQKENRILTLIIYNYKRDFYE